jgi:uncharacterized repeat protein (TIGR03806 family)
MKRIHLFLTFSLVIYIFFGALGCKKDTVIEPATPVDPNAVSVVLASVPYQKLSDYKFFIGEMKNQEPNNRVIPYVPASTLFTDYALKKRFVWMPIGKKATYNGDGKVLELPVGSVLIKSFYYENVQPSNSTKILETRVMIRKSSGWIFAEYVWNDEQTEAFLSMNGSTTSISWMQDGSLKSTNYRIPSETECLTCHKKQNQPIPIGIKPQNLNVSYNYSSGAQNQLQKWISLGMLENNLPGTIVSTVDYHDVSKSIDLRFRSYIDMNCAHCHAEGAHCDYRPMRLAFSETALPINLGLCVEPEEFINASLINIITPGNKNKSMMHYRLSSTLESERMPLLGRTLVHQEGVALLEEWIEWKQDCN